MSAVFGGATAKEWEFVATVYDKAVDGILAIVETPDFEDGYEYRLDFEGLSGSATNASPQCALYKATEALYTASAIDTQTALSGAANILNGRLYLPDVRENSSLHVAHGVMVNPSQDIQRGFHGALAMAAQKIGKAKLDFTLNANFDAGTIKLYRRAF